MHERIEAVSMVAGLMVGDVATEKNITALVQLVLDDCVDFAQHSLKQDSVDAAVARTVELIKLNYGYPK